MINTNRIQMPSDLSFTDLSLALDQDGYPTWSNEVMGCILTHNEIAKGSLDNNQTMVMILLIYLDTLKNGGQADDVADILLRRQLTILNVERISKANTSAVLPSPTAQEVSDLIAKSAMTKTDIADLIGVNGRQLIYAYEKGVKTPSPQTWTLWNLLTNNHPTLMLTKRQQIPFQPFVSKD